jgi:hypothetical protein
LVSRYVWREVTHPVQTKATNKSSLDYLMAIRPLDQTRFLFFLYYFPTTMPLFLAIICIFKETVFLFGRKYP